jgi:hypothetical protein
MKHKKYPVMSYHWSYILYASPLLFISVPRTIFFEAQLEKESENYGKHYACKNAGQCIFIDKTQITEIAHKSIQSAYTFADIEPCQINDQNGQIKYQSTDYPLAAVFYLTIGSNFKQP